jgi:hypothetical protein
MGSYGLPPSAARNILLVGLGERSPDHPVTLLMELIGEVAGFLMSTAYSSADFFALGASTSESNMDSAQSTVPSNITSSSKCAHDENDLTFLGKCLWEF